MPDGMWWWILSAIIIAAGLVYDNWQREKVYRQIRHDTAHIGEPDPVPSLWPSGASDGLHGRGRAKDDLRLRLDD